MNSEMALGMSERVKPIHAKVAAMIRDEIMPLDEEFLAEVGKGGTAGPTPPGRPKSWKA